MKKHPPLLREFKTVEHVPHVMVETLSALQKPGPLTPSASLPWMLDTIESMQESSSLQHSLTAEVWFPPFDQNAFPSTRSGIGRNSRAQAILAVRTRANIIAAVLQIWRRANFMVARLERGRHQN